MYYEEKIIDGELMYRTSPDGGWRQFSHKALSLKLSETKARIAELKAEKAELEKQEPVGWTERDKLNPKVRGEYIVYRAGLDRIEIANYGTSKKWDNGRGNRRDNIYRVTHWMPLPAAPKEVE